jgi:hypothetical protein
MLNIEDNTGYVRHIISSTTRPIVSSKNNKKCHSPVSNIYVAVKNMFHPAAARKLSTNLYDIYHCRVYSEKTPDDGQRNCPKHVEFHSKINLRN